MSNQYLRRAGAEKEMSNPRGSTGRASTGKSTAPTPEAKTPQAAKLSAQFPCRAMRNQALREKSN